MSFKKEIESLLLFKAIFLIFFGLFWGSAWGEKLIVVEKASRVLFLYQDGVLIRSFPCSLGWNPHQPKRREGDGATPEGLYVICDKHPSKRYYLFLGLSYPNEKDIERAFWEGRLSREEFERYMTALRSGGPLGGPLGGAIGIHGGGLYRRGPKGLRRDWTLGCIALNDTDVAEVYRFAEVGTPVFIYDATKTLFAIFSQLVTIPERYLPRLDRLPWQAEFKLSTFSLDFRLLLREDRDGLCRLWIWGYEPVSHRLLFWIADYNANGRLDPLDQFRSLAPGAELWDYRRVREVILQSLPRWLAAEERRGEPLRLCTP